MNKIIAFFAILLLFLNTDLVSAHGLEEGEAEFRIIPSAQNVSPGESLNITIMENSKETQINSIQFNLTYPENKLKFMNIDTSQSAFKIQSENNNASGIIMLSGKATPSVNGEQLVASITFQTIQSTNVNELIPTAGNTIITSEDNENIYSSTDIMDSSKETQDSRKQESASEEGIFPFDQRNALLVFGAIGFSALIFCVIYIVKKKH